MWCFKCEKSLAEALEGTSLQPDDGTMWSSTGNYGSRIFDPCDEADVLLLHVCDDCLKSHIHLVHGSRNQEPVSAAELIS